MNMRHRNLVLGFTIIVLVLIAGCSSNSVKESDNPRTTSSLPLDSSTITHAELTIFPENWDSDAENDGGTLFLTFLDQSDNSVLAGRNLNFPMDIEVWTLKKGSYVYSNTNRDQKIFSRSTTLESVDASHEVGMTRISGNNKLRIGYDELKNYKSSTLGILIKIHLPDGRTIEASDRLFIPPSNP